MSDNTVRINPEGMHRNPAYSQAVRVRAGGDLVFIGGQNGVDATGQIVGKGDLKAQTIQALKNVRTILEYEGLSLSSVVKWTILVIAGQDIQQGFAAFQEVWDKDAPAPAITFAFVSALAHPDFLVEMEAVAAG
jgi:enamine deaminase RidA (YjgF/YER057c/UK114 family)